MKLSSIFYLIELLEGMQDASPVANAEGSNYWWFEWNASDQSILDELKQLLEEANNDQ